MGADGRVDGEDPPACCHFGLLIPGRLAAVIVCSTAASSSVGLHGMRQHVLTWGMVVRANMHA